MEIPKEFRTICHYFVQDMNVFATTPEAFIRFATQELSVVQKRIVITFLDDLLGDQVTDQFLQDVWWSSGANIHFLDEAQLRRTLELMRLMLSAA